MAVLRGEQYLTRKAQFDLVYHKGGSWVDKAIVLRAMRNRLEISRYGFTVSRRVGNAVTRNRIKRLLREILRKTLLKSGWDMVFIARASAADIDYTTLEKSVGRLLYNAGIVTGEYEEARSGAD